MRFSVGPWKYRVGICPGELREDGSLVDAITHDRVILISGEVRPRDRLRPLLDQLRRIHETHYGPLTSEGIATFTADVLRQLRTQGDESTLMRITAEGWRDAGGADDVAAEPFGCECGQCGTHFASHQISTETPAFNGELTESVVRRSVTCDFCGDVMVWSEGVTASGVPNGRVYAGPEYVKVHGVSRV